MDENAILISLTRGECESLATWVRAYLIDYIRTDTEIKNVDFILDVSAACKKIEDVLENEDVYGD